MWKHEQDCPVTKNGRGKCACEYVRMAYKRGEAWGRLQGREEAGHGDCICTKVAGEFWQDGTLQWLYVDGVKFVAAARGDGNHE